MHAQNRPRGRTLSYLTVDSRVVQHCSKQAWGEPCNINFDSRVVQHQSTALNRPGENPVKFFYLQTIPGKVCHLLCLHPEPRADTSETPPLSSTQVG